MTDLPEEIISYKILILGDSEVGKTSFILRFCDNTFPEESITTIGIDTKTKFIKFEDKKIQLVIWDTAGQERFRSIAKNSIKGAEGILVMYAINNRKSFNAIKMWINNIKESLNTDKIGLMVIGNKCDVPPNERQVDQDMLKELESKEKVNVIEVSAKDDINVNETFVKLVEQMLKLGLGKKKQSSGADDKNITIKGDNNRKNNNGGCCKR
jgi:small GTP-binding protein